MRITHSFSTTLKSAICGVVIIALRMYSSSLKKGLVEGGRWSVSRSKSSKVDNVNKYINTWLGSDLKVSAHRPTD